MEMEKQKIKPWKIISIILILLILCLIIDIVRKDMILNDIQKKIGRYKNSNNVYCRINSGKSIMETYIKDNKEKKILDFKDKPIKIVNIQDDNTGKKYEFFKDTKKVQIGDSMLLSNNSTIFDINDSIIKESFLYKMKNYMKMRILTEKINNKEYYVVCGNFTEGRVATLGSVSSRIYIDKETGLVMKIVDITKEKDTKKEHVLNYEYKFGIVKNQDLEEPSMVGYSEL